MWADSCRNIISRNPTAASRKTSHGDAAAEQADRDAVDRQQREPGQRDPAQPAGQEVDHQQAERAARDHQRRDARHAGRDRRLVGLGGRSRRRRRCRRGGGRCRSGGSGRATQHQPARTRPTTRTWSSTPARRGSGRGAQQPHRRPTRSAATRSSGPRYCAPQAAEAAPRQHGDPGGRGGDHRERQVAAGVGRAGRSSGSPRRRRRGASGGAHRDLWVRPDLVGAGPTGRRARWSGRGPARPGRAGRADAGSRRASPGARASVARSSVRRRARRCDGAQAETSRASARADPAWWCIRRSIGPSASVIAPITASSRPPWVDSASQPVSMRVAGDRLDDGQRLEHRAGVELGVAGVPGGAEVVAGGGDQPDGEAALPEVDRDRRGGRDRRLERRGDALSLVGADPVVDERAWRGTATAAPRGAPSARRRAPSCASGRGAGRRRGGTRAP